MKEGWCNDRYFVLFDEPEWTETTRGYFAGGGIPGHTVIGLLSWDDLIVCDEFGRTFSLPAVPMEPHYRSELHLPDLSDLAPESRFTGKIKWYVKPIVFGGDPNEGPNVIWVSHQQHRELVAWWNAKYREVKANGAAA